MLVATLFSNKVSLLRLVTGVSIERGNDWEVSPLEILRDAERELIFRTIVAI